MSTGDPPLLLLCVGTERWLRAEAVEEIKRRCLRPGFEETDFVRFSGPAAEPQAILEAVRTAAFGSPRRLVLVEGLEELTPESAPWLEELLACPNPAACVVLCVDRLEKERQMLPAALQRSGQVRIVRCLSLSGPLLEDWVARRCRQKGKGIEPRAVPELVRRMGSSLQALDLALDSLVLMAGDSPSVRFSDVEALVAPSLHQTAFDILDDAAAGRTARAVLAMREAMAQGRMNTDQLFGALGWYLRKHRRNSPALRKLLEELLRADLRIKLGHPSPEWLAERLLLRLR